MEYFIIPGKEQEYIELYGGVIIKIDQTLLQAHYIRIDEKRKKLYAEGEVKITLPNGFFFRTEKLILSLEKKKGYLLNLSSQAPSFQVHAKSTEIWANKTLRMEDAFFTTCMLPNPHYSFRVKSLYVFSNRDIFGYNAWYYVGNTPVFYFPFLFHTKEGTGIRTQYGYTNLQGHFLQNTYYFGPGKIFFDWYQKTGILGGIKWEEKEYTLDVEVAQYKEREIIGDQVLNQIIFPDGSVGEKTYTWYKIFSQGDLSFLAHHRLKWSILYYNNKNFEPEFGIRYEPRSFLEMLRAFLTVKTKNPVYSLPWNFQYTYQKERRLFSLKAQRNWYWFQKPQEEDSRYAPIYDLLPSLYYQEGISLLGGDFQYSLGYSLHHYYNEGNLIKQFSEGKGSFSYRVFLPIFSLFSLSSKWGLSFSLWRKEIGDIASEEEAKIKSFISGFGENSAILGHPWHFFRITHKIEQAFLRAKPDPELGNQIENRLEGEYFFSPFPPLKFSLKSGWNLKKYYVALPLYRRAYPIQGKVEIEYDFFRPYFLFPYPFVKRKGKYSLLLKIKEEIQYYLAFQRWGKNLLEISLEYRFPYLLSLLQTGIKWEENFIYPVASYLSSFVGFSFSPFSYWRIGGKISSRIDRLESFRFLSQERWALQKVEFLLMHDIHDWNFYLGYRIQKRIVSFGLNQRDFALFYEESVFFILELKALEFKTTEIPIYQTPFVESS